MKHEGNLIQDWNNIEDVLSIHITLAMYDPTKPTPDNQERFTESVGNTHFDSSWVTGYDEVFPSVELTFNGAEWVPQTRTSSSFEVISTRISLKEPWARFQYDYSLPPDTNTRYGLMTRVTLFPDETGSREYINYYGINPNTFELQIPLFTFFEEPTTEEPVSEPSFFPGPDPGRIHVVTAPPASEWGTSLSDEEWKYPPAWGPINNTYDGLLDSRKIETGASIKKEIYDDLFPGTIISVYF
jgi:hypothetical protein